MTLRRWSYFRRYWVDEALSNLGAVVGVCVFFGPTWDAVVGGQPPSLEAAA